ncbi:hypothetical protein MYCTH_2304416 [Thermothelomyces thermophilus ATCC 42464]|uniref:Uncharacterized protein n=1 Tax=Thermothelomyces thermophilus (strain ATCC 42464 / BCRC 31852 / DSM 1799) TaxID=573729 RepID=G2QEK8_THET4|nr:uncharacterized protein MYCTH_2304416 [Thermothelomyces thermophilus ATCC 42464]AEO57791.1 hypothetical protein MYCTH_2304416 [Thermothelomyces thermophilus ATCC 42464]
MAPVEVEHHASPIPLFLAAFRIAAAAYVSYTVWRSLYRSHKALGPAQDTRTRTAERSKLTVVFGSLAALGLVFAVTSSLEYLTLSYKVWASERGVDVPESLFNIGRDGPALYLKHWLSDTPVFLDALEIIAEETPRLWWGQQVDLATISWTALLAVEGRRRRIPHLWAHALLPHLVSLSFAQNLFYVALLQTPAPIPAQETRIARVFHRLLPKKPNNWFPKLSLIVAPLVLNYLVTFWLPATAGTPSFPNAVLLTKLLTLAPLVLPAIAPASWGVVHADPHDAYPDVIKLFNLISAASGLLHAKTTVSALLFNLPDSHRHRHSIKIPLDTEKRSKWERTATAAEKVLGSMTDHPAVAAAGRDALLCALSLGLWAAVRSTDVGNMLRALHNYSTSPSRGGSGRSGGGKRGKTTETPRPARAREEAAVAAAAAAPSNGIPPLSMTLRRRGRQKRPSVSSAGSADGPSEDAAAQQQAPKRRGRPKKAKSEPEPEPEPGPGQDRADLEPEEETYRPTPAARADVGLGDVVPEDDFDWEAAALTWGLTAVGGLGLGSAAVFGAECLAR